MIFLEMSRHTEHGGGSWSFPNCVWAPTEKQNGANWAFWRKILKIREGAIILHLRGVNPDANFIGFSVASGDGFETSRRPPDPEEWSFAKAFYRADLTGFTQFHKPVNLNELFQCRRKELEEYFDHNKLLGSRKANIFFVRQGGRLQCLNGAYLSDVDESLLSALFGGETSVVSKKTGETVVSVETGTQLRIVSARLGQKKFSDQIKDCYGNRCCFPDCDVSDPRFLVGAHIARWSDNEELRGRLGNGLCLCLMHDKAFERGLFTLDEKLRVFVNPAERGSGSTVVQGIVAGHSKPIALGKVSPLDDALLEHWVRVNIDPTDL